MFGLTGEFSEDEWKVVRARIEAMPDNMKLSIGGFKSLDKNELLQHIDNKDELGKLLVKVHFNYLRSFKEEAKMLPL